MSTSTMMSRSPSPSFSSRRAYSPSPSPAPFLTPNPFERELDSRPLPRRLHSLQNRPSPYPVSSPSSPTSLAPTVRPTLGASVKRPGVPHRSHSFCASGTNTTYALASTPTSNLSPDKRILVAPPLERTLSSIGSRGNCSPPTQQMQRPFPGAQGENIENMHRSPSRQSQRAVTGSIDGVLGEKDVNFQSLTPINLNASCTNLPTPPMLPTIIVSASITPPRPSLSTMRSASGSSAASRTSSYQLQTPTTPHDLLFGKIEESEEEDISLSDRDETESVDSGKRGHWKHVEGVAMSVEKMVIG